MSSAEHVPADRPIAGIKPEALGYLSNPCNRDAAGSITTLSPDPFDLLQSIPVAVSEIDGEYVAALPEADISISGDTAEEAVENLRFLLVDLFDDLEAAESQLGPLPKRQLAVLRTYMRRQV